MSTPTPLPLVDGGSVVVLACDEQQVTLEAGFASPPGSSVRVVLAGAPIAIKVRSCRKQARAELPADTARYVIDGRWVNMSRAQREALPR